MSDHLRSVLQQSVEEVLERMFFIRFLDELIDPPPPDNGFLAATLTFEGEPSGSLVLRITPDAARSISADFLGLDEGELTGRQVGEVICELANMICGCVLSRMDSAATFRIVPPKLVDSAEGGPVRQLRGGERASHSVEIAGGSLTVLLNAENSECLTAEKLASL